MAEYGRVVVGVSGSLASLAALRRGVREARRDGRTLVAVAAWEPPEGEALHARWPDASWAGHWRHTARNRLHRAFDEALGGTPRGLRVVRTVARDAPGAALCTLAHRPDDLLIIGAARQEGLRARLHRCPVRRYVLAHAECAVLAVPGPHLSSEARAFRRALAARSSALASYAACAAPCTGGTGGGRPEQAP
ncbi:universal stress protein [Streptomyces sp. ODS28]|uniref:universal stress protein n=1 Tax=Streptomyces sp. ODS28 TaxID=3136688 RepID=UPI0031EFC83A